MHKILKVTVADELYEQVLKTRYDVLREPLGLVITDAELERDKTLVYFAYVKDDVVLGVVGLDLSNGQILQMAVRQNTQGSGVGRELVTAAEEYARVNGVKEIFLHSRLNVRGFYERLKYQSVGEIYEKIGLPHINMFKSLF